MNTYMKRQKMQFYKLYSSRRAVPLHTFEDIWEEVEIAYENGLLSEDDLFDHATTLLLEEL